MISADAPGAVQIVPPDTARSIGTEINEITERRYRGRAVVGWRIQRVERFRRREPPFRIQRHVEIVIVTKYVFPQRSRPGSGVRMFLIARSRPIGSEVERRVVGRNRRPVVVEFGIDRRTQVDRRQPHTVAPSRHPQIVSADTTRPITVEVERQAVARRRRAEFVMVGVDRAKRLGFGPAVQRSVSRVNIRPAARFSANEEQRSPVGGDTRFVIVRAGVDDLVQQGGRLPQHITRSSRRNRFGDRVGVGVKRQAPRPLMPSNAEHADNGCEQYADDELLHAPTLAMTISHRVQSRPVDARESTVPRPCRGTAAERRRPCKCRERVPRWHTRCCDLRER